MCLRSSHPTQWATRTSQTSRSCLSTISTFRRRGTCCCECSISSAELRISICHSTPSKDREVWHLSLTLIMIWRHMLWELLRMVFRWARGNWGLRFLSHWRGYTTIRESKKNRNITTTPRISRGNKIINPYKRTTTSSSSSSSIGEPNTAAAAVKVGSKSASCKEGGLDLEMIAAV